MSPHFLPRAGRFHPSGPASTLLLLGLLALAPGCRRENPVQVQVERVVRRNLTELVSATGRVQPVTQVKISPEVSGEIVELPVKEGDRVRRGDVLVRIRRDLYEAGVQSAEASHRSAQASEVTAQANARKAAAEFERNRELFDRKLLSASMYDEFRTALEVARAQADAAGHQVAMAQAALNRAQEDLTRTTIHAPIDGTVSRLNSEAGERVVGTGMMAGTEIMTIADLTEMEARVEVGEVDVVLIEPGQRARIEVDSFRDRKFGGRVTQVARSARTQGAGSQQEATKFEVRIHIEDKEPFLPGMSVTAEIETRYRTNVLTVPIQSVTTRLPQGAPSPAEATPKPKKDDAPEFALVDDRRPKERAKAQEVVFVLEGDQVRQRPVGRGISDDNHYEILSGVAEGDEVVTGPFRAISKDLSDGRQATTRTNPPSRFLPRFGGPDR